MKKSDDSLGLREKMTMVWMTRSDRAPILWRTVSSVRSGGGR